MKRSISEIKRKVKKRVFVKLSDGITIKNIDEIAIIPTLKCNLNCVMCHQRQIKHKPNLNLEKFRKIVRKLKKSGVTKISIIGGEIFILPNIWDYINEMESQGMKYDLSSNLFSVKNIKKIKLLKGLEKVTTSIDGNKEIHNKIRRDERAFQNTIENIKELVREGIRIDVACVVQRANLNILDELTEMICKLGIESMTFLGETSITEKEKENSKRLIKKMTGKDSEIKISSLENPLGSINMGDILVIKKKVRDIKEITKRYNVKVSLAVQLLEPELLSKSSLKDYTCWLFNGYNFIIDNEGCLNPCGFVKMDCDNNVLNKNSPIEIVNTEHYKKMRKYFKENGAMEKCRMCCSLKKKSCTEK